MTTRRTWRCLLAGLLVVGGLAIIPALAVGETANDIPSENEPVVVESILEAEPPITIGDRFSFTVEILHPTGTDVEIDRPSDRSRWTELERQLDVEEGPESATTRATLHYGVFRPGPTSGPPVVARILSDGDEFELDLAEHNLDVESVTDEDASLGSPRSPWVLLTEQDNRIWFAAGAVGFALLTIFGVLAIRRRRRRTFTELMAPADVVALKALTELRDEDLIADEQWMAFYVRLSEIVRRYLGQRWNFPGTELTTTELVERLRSIDDDRLIDPDIIKAWLGAGDRVKFAGYIPGEEESRRRLDEAFDLVEKTRHIPTDDDDDTNDNNDDDQTAGDEDKDKTNQKTKDMSEEEDDDAKREEVAA